MFAATSVLLLVLPFTPAAEPILAPGAQFTFRGSVAEASRDRGQPAQPGKSFDLILWVAESDDSGTQLYWLVDERGQGAWPWVERFGRLVLDKNGKPIGPSGPALLYDYGTGKNVIPILAPFVVSELPLAKGVEWQYDGFDHAVDGNKQIDDRDTWQVTVRNGFGLKRTMWIDKDSPLVVSLSERVFMDKGTEYQLDMKLVGVETMSADAFLAIKSGAGALLGLREKLKRPARSQSEEFTPEQRAVLAEHLPKLKNDLKSGPIARLVQTASRELEVQSGRADALAQLSSKHVSKAVEKFSTLSLSGDAITEAELKDVITVLHFWEYREEPLKEPYGQVGYLEFLYNRHKDEGLKVYGVAVDGRLQAEGTRRAAAAGVRKLKSFMNLTYPILLDEGTLIKQFGDPRLLGASLPLFVVVGRDGKVAHYHVGFYPVDREAGLKQLDAVVARLTAKAEE